MRSGSRPLTPLSYAKYARRAAEAATEAAAAGGGREPLRVRPWAAAAEELEAKGRPRSPRRRQQQQQQRGGRPEGKQAEGGMADPLRRTLSKLRGRREARGGDAKAPPRRHHGNVLMEPATGPQSSAEGEGGPRLPPLPLPPPPPPSRLLEEEKEEEDYYDNLPDGGEGVQGGKPRESAGRLRIQLQEAYALLLHAMHGLPPPPSWSFPDSQRQGCSAPPLPSSSPPLPPPLRKRLSKSLDGLPGAQAKTSLRRSRSEGADVGPAKEEEEEEDEALWDPRRRERGPKPHPPLPPPSEEPTEKSLPPPPAPSPAPSASFKPPALTVRKLQKWMYKGRLLSLAIKGRGGGAAGETPSSPCPPPPAKGTPPPPPPSDQRIFLTDLIENVYIPSVSRRELKTFKANEGTECRPRFASITVSKKRNWLHQSSPRVSNLEKGNTYKKTSGESHRALKFPSPLLEPKISRSFPKKLLGHESPKRTVNFLHAAENGMNHLTLQNHALDFSEDNDADDEGEIWYNPIPEDDEPDFPCFQSGNADRSDSQAINYKLPSGNCLIKVARHNEHLPQFSDSTGNTQPREVNQIDCVHSMEHLQVHKPKPTCSILTGFVTDDSPTLKGTLAGYGVVSSSKPDTATAECSPPSPNPLKKGGSINWSFPDKIKSPRTVRKLSMKMKKLPELSRKLSVKGNSSHNSTDNPSLLKHNCQDMGHAALPSSGNMLAAAASRNVISRYHLDSSVSSQHSYKKKNNRSSKSSSKGGYLSDGDSPELIAKSGKHAGEGRAGKGKEGFPSSNGNKTDIDIDAFRHYSFSDQPKCSQYISGLMSIHFYGAEDLKPPRMDSKDVFCAIQVDSVNKARTALLTCRTTFLDMDHTFNIEIENAQHLKLVVFSWEPMPRKNRVCCHGTVVLPALFRVTRTHQLAVKLEPRGLIYVKLTLLEQWENSLNGLDGEQEPVMFGIEARKVVEKENVGLMVPLLMKKCIMEIEKRGCQVVGLYRLCGSAAVKKELREAFEKDSKAVTLCETQYPDINVITGVLKDYLRELPSPLITKQLYEAVLDAMGKKPLRMIANGCENDPSDSDHTVALLDCLPEVEKATLKMLLDHLKLVASYHEVNRMTCQNLAVCFGPVLLSQRQETTNHNNRVFTDSEELASALDFKKHIEVLHYLLQLWPVQHSGAKESAPAEQQSSVNYLRPKKQRPQMLNLSSSEMSGILRSRTARLDSPSSNRYAGDWSGCGESYFASPKEALSEADYDDVPSEDTESGDDGNKADVPEKLIEHPNCTSKEQTFQAYLTMQTMDSAVNHRVNLKDLQESIDTLIGNLERELNKNKLNIRY
ncbi:rho GTPase-activating protein SYDE2 isoform X1 [Anolis sagrei]|uniref:rho GTPase-activating protein SYDE2 isoform X1 n=1 Tax=Anolis sagrei TaxID=38937 RepID=UPI0035203101